VGRTLQAAFRGLEAASLRWGNDEVVLRVKMDERYAHDPELLSTLRVPGSEGRTVDLSSVAEIRRASGYSRITRINQERVLTVSGDVDDRVTTSAMVNNVIKEWIPELLKDRPGYSIVLSGENEDTERSLGAMQFAALVALLLIYGILATISNSFVQPLVIMAVIPFGIVGVFLGLIFMGEPMGLMSIMGTIALAGIVVNNSVVLVDFINRYRHQHGGAAAADQAEIENIREQPRNLSRRVRWRSIISSGHTRFRPIILTSATTVAGLMSLALTRSGQEQFLAPMAQAIVWGLSFATLITLVLIPCLYAVLDDILVWREKRRNRKEMRPRSLEV
jgi:multidrug efflux pump subunit AcrB